MQDVCFYSCFDYVWKDIGEGLMRSVKKFYPDIPFICCDFPRAERGAQFDQRGFEDFHILKGTQLLEEYKRIIFIDCDSIMCNECPELFGDYDMGFVLNNIPTDNEYGGITGRVYINNGLTVCTNKDTWAEYQKEYTVRNNQSWNALNAQNAANYVFHTSRCKKQLLEYKDKSYGISDLFSYEDMYIQDGHLYVNNKKLCIFHAAGEQWKNYAQISINYDKIINHDARDMLKGMTNA